jgi:hypothetical protein
MATEPPRRERRPTPTGSTTAHVARGSSSSQVVVIAVIGVAAIALAGYVVARLMGLL